MSNPNGETLMKEEATYDRLSKDMANAKNDIADLTDQITNALNTLAGAAKQQAQTGYNTAQGAATTVEETLEDAVVRRPLAAVGLAFGLGLLVGVAWRR